MDGDFSNLDQDLQHTVKRVLDIIRSHVGDFPWDRAIGKICGDRVKLDGGLLTGSPVINIIPGQNASACLPIVFAFASGLGNKRTSLRPVLNALSEHIATCSEITKSVVMVTDTIDPRTMSDRAKLFEIYSQKGVSFEMYLVRQGQIFRVPFFQ